MNTPEGRVKDAVKKVLRGNDIWFYMPVQNGMGMTGIPDFVCCAPITITPEMVGKTYGFFLGIETKAVGKESNVSANQQRVIAAINNHGGVAFVTSDAELVMEKLQEHIHG